MNAPRYSRFRRILLLTPLLVGGLVGPGAQAATVPAPPGVAAVTSATGAHTRAISPICETRLPDQADDTIALIDQGGPYPYPQDGTVFQNREGLLPQQPRGFYHEFTVRTPGSPDRGARRIITSGNEGHDGMYWTPDHYRTFYDIDFGC
ncbi:ribonuclease domain-containing protein [Actinomadura macra]|uniref:ribonuclease domain-containing protein n=1 Tax=Actinomadura macra TaxID=46164 RepID=UPI000833414C|nr:ribonuclease domain-containing protein [Actinomadura macra]